MWEKAIADGNCEQMFGMNIKQEGIEVQGDQVGSNKNQRLVSKKYDDRLT